VNDAASTAPANAAPRPRWQFSLRTLFVATTLIVIPLAAHAAGFSGLTFELGICVCALFFTAGIGRLYARHPELALRVVRSMPIVLIPPATLMASKDYFVHRQPIVNALFVWPLFTATYIGVLWGAAREIAQPPICRTGNVVICLASSVLLINIFWLGLAFVAESQSLRINRHADELSEAGLSWCWAEFRPICWARLRLYNLWTIGVTEDARAITDADLEQIARVDCVVSLDLRGGPATDAGLAHLKSLHNLQSLDVRGTKVSSAALDDLRRALPNLTCVKH
jgi:hypothetical protein